MLSTTRGTTKRCKSKRGDGLIPIFRAYSCIILSNAPSISKKCPNAICLESTDMDVYRITILLIIQNATQIWNSWEGGKAPPWLFINAPMSTDCEILKNILWRAFFPGIQAQFACWLKESLINQSDLSVFQRNYIIEMNLKDLLYRSGICLFCKWKLSYLFFFSLVFRHNTVGLLQPKMYLGIIELLILWRLLVR